MGDDWCRMDVVGDRDELIRLINEEAQAIQRIGRGLLADLHPLLENMAESDQEREIAYQQWDEIGETLYKLIVIEEWDENAATPSIHRMSSIGRSYIFPGEWRIEAYRSFLPEEVPGMLEKWQGYVKDVKAGAYQAYHFEWYLYATSSGMRRYWTYLQDRAELAQERENAWAMRLKETSLLDRIKDFSVMSPVYPVPAWDEWKEKSGSVHYEEDERYIQLQDAISHYLTLQREWNSQVPSSKKQMYEPRTFEGYLDRANWNYQGSLFDWLAQCVKDGKGLYLWV